MSRKQIIGKILLALHAADGVPMPESAIVRGAQVLSRPDEPTIGDVLEALKVAQAQKLVDGITDDVTETSYALTKLGKHQARQL